MNKKMSTKVLSARVTPDVYVAWQTLAKDKGMSVSECLRDAVTMVDTKAVLKAQDKIEVPDDLKETLLALSGGAVAGVLIYKGIHAILEKKSDFNLEDIKAISGFLAVAGSVFIGTGIYRALK